MTATATAPARQVEPKRAAPRPTPRSGANGSAARVPRPLQVVEPPKRRYPARAVAIAAVALVFGSMLTSAVFHSVLVSGQARIDELGRQITVAEKGLAQDRLELARLSSPGRIATEAERLGLVVADRQTWIRPGSGESPVVTGATGDDASTGSTGESEVGSSTAEELAATSDEGRGAVR